MNIIEQALKLVPAPRREPYRALVVGTHMVSPQMRRISLGGPDIKRFMGQPGSSAPAAWIKVFVSSAQGQPVGRAYTIRQFDPHEGRLDIDVVLHDLGPLSRWAAQTKSGDVLSFAGPRDGGFLLRRDTRWLMLVGDASALPAIESIAATLPPKLNATVLVQVADEHEIRCIESPAHIRVQWLVHPDGADGTGPAAQMLDAVRDWQRPGRGAGQVWLAGEASCVSQIKNHVLDAWSISPERLSAKGYWRAGQADFRR